MQVSSSTDQRDLYSFAAEIATLKARIDTLEQGTKTTQLGNSSIENASLTVYDSDGLARNRIGLQADGTYVGGIVVNNPVPPQVPAAPTVIGILGGLRVSSNGPSGGEWPADFNHLNVYVKIGTADAALVTTIMPEPGMVTIASLGVYDEATVWLTAVNQAGTESSASIAVTGTPSKTVSNDILDGAVSELKLAAQAVTAAKIAAGAVGTAQIAGQAVNLAKLADGSVNAQKLINGAVVTEKIAAGAIVSELIAANTIAAGNIAASAITTEKLAANSVSAEKVAAAAISAEKIAAGAVTADKILALAITADKLAANSVTATSIQAGAVTAAALEADMVISKRIIAGSANAARSELNPTLGFVVYDSSGALMAQLNGTNNFVRGNLISGTNTQGVSIQPDSSSGLPLIDITDDAGTTFNRISATTGGVLQIARRNKSTPANVEGGFIQFGSSDAYLGYRIAGNAYETSRIVATSASIAMELWSSSTTLANNITMDTSVSRTVTAWACSNSSSNVFRFRAGSTIMRANWNGSALVFTNDSSVVTYSKTFVIQHPTAEDRFLVHGCTESPVSGVEYWGSAVVRNGRCEVTLPPYFEALTKFENRAVLVTPIGNPVAVSASYPTNGTFEIRGEGTFGVSWLVKAERHGADFPTEPRKSSVTVRGDGPYRYIEY